MKVNLTSFFFFVLDDFFDRNLYLYPFPSVWKYQFCYQLASKIKNCVEKYRLENQNFFSDQSSVDYWSRVKKNYVLIG